MADLFRLDPLNQEEEKEEKKLFTIAPMGQEDSTYKNILEENKDIPFIDRVLNPQKYPSPTLTDDQGRKQTHFMSADKDENDNWIVYPKIIYQDDEYKRVNMQEAVASGNFINFESDQQKAIDFSKNYKTQEFKDFYNTKSESKKNKIFTVSPMEEEDGGFIDALKPRGGKKLYDGIIGAYEQTARLPSQIARSIERTATEDLIDDLNRSLGDDNRSFVENFLLRGNGFKNRYERQVLERELGISDRGNLSILWNTVFGTDQIENAFNIKKLSRQEKIQAREELTKKAIEHAEIVSKENAEYNKKRQKLYKDRGYSKDEISIVGGVSSLVPSLASMGAAVLTKKPAVAFATLPYFGILTQQEVYEDSISRGLSEEDARYNSYLQGGSEVASELLVSRTVVRSLDGFFKKQKQNVKQLILEGGGILAAEAGGEQLNTIAQSLFDAYFDNQEELRIAWDNRENPLYEGPTWQEVMAERGRATAIASLVAGGGIVTTNGVIKYNASKDWIKNSKTPEKTKDLIDQVIIQKELDKVAIDQAGARASDPDVINDRNIDPAEFIVEEMLKIEMPGKRSEPIDEDQVVTELEPINKVSNIDEALDNVEKYLDGKGYDTDKLDLSTGRDFAAELRGDAANQIKLMGSLGFKVDLNNVEATANKIDEFIIGRNAEKNFKKKVKPQPKERLTLPKKFVPRRARQLLVGAMPKNATDIEEASSAMGFDPSRIPPVYLAKNSPVSPVDGKSVFEIGDDLVIRMQGLGFRRDLVDPSKPSEFTSNEAYEIIANNEIFPDDVDKYTTYITEMDTAIGMFIEKNPGVTAADIKKAAGSRSIIEIENSLDRLENEFNSSGSSFRSETNTGERRYFSGATPIVEEVRSEEAGIESTLQEVPETAQPISLEDFENIPSFPADQYFNEQDKLPIYPDTTTYDPKNSPLKPKRAIEKEKAATEKPVVSDDEYRVFNIIKQIDKPLTISNVQTTLKTGYIKTRDAINSLKEKGYIKETMIIGQSRMTAGRTPTTAYEVVKGVELQKARSKKDKPIPPAVVSDGDGGTINLDGGSNITDDQWGIGHESKMKERASELEFLFQNTVGRVKDVEVARDVRAEELSLPKLTISQKPSEAFARLPGVRNTKYVESLEEAEAIVNKMIEEKVKGDDVDIIARALHAPERNRKIYQDKLKDIDELQESLVNKELTDTDKKNLEKLKQEAEKFKNNGSGISTAEAIDVLERYGIEFDGVDAKATSELGAKYLEIVDQYHNYIKKTVTEYNEGSLIDEATSEDYKSNANYKYYVPLTGWAADTTLDKKPNRKGKGLSIRGPENEKAKGRTSVSASPFVQMVLQRQNAIDRATKNDVLIRLSKLFTEEFDGSDIADVTTFKPKEMEGVFGFKEDGKQNWLKVYDEKLIRGLNAYDAQVLGRFTSLVRPFSRLQSALYTAFSPPFVLYNFSRDLIAGGIAIHTEQQLPGGRAEGKRIFTRSVKNVLPRLAQFHKGIKGKEIKEEGIQEAYDMFNKYGANSGFVTTLGQERISDFYKELQSKYEGTTSLADPKKLLLKVGGGLKKPFKATANFMYDLNSAVENGIRFSTFVEFIKAENNGQIKGAKKETLEQAASLAKQLTIDYTTKGHLSNSINSHFIFFNAAVQSNIPLYRALAKSPKLALQIGGGLASFGSLITLYNFMVSDEDETGRPIYENISERYGNRYVILMMPNNKMKEGDKLDQDSQKLFAGGPLTVNGRTVAFAYPQPLGFNIPFNLGRQGTELAAHKIFRLQRPTKSVAKAGLEMFDNLSTGVMPIGVNISRKEGIEGFASTTIRALTPSYAKPLTELAVNENFFNVPITKKFFGGKQGLPQSSVVTSYDKDIYISMAQIVNNMTGGNNETLESGFLDMQPGQIKYIVEYYGGGPLSFAGKVNDSIHKYMYDEIKDVKDIPFLNTYAVQEQDGVYARRFYEGMEDVEAKVLRYKTIESKEARDKYYEQNKNVIALDYLSESEEALKKVLPKEIKDTIRKPLTDIRRRLKNLKESQKTVVALQLREKDPSTYYQKINKITDQKKEIYVDFLKLYEKAMAEDEKSQD